MAACSCARPLARPCTTSPSLCWRKMGCELHQGLAGWLQPQGCTQWLHVQLPQGPYSVLFSTFISDTEPGSVHLSCCRGRRAERCSRYERRKGRRAEEPGQAAELGTRELSEVQHGQVQGVEPWPTEPCPLHRDGSRRALRSPPTEGTPCLPEERFPAGWQMCISASTALSDTPAHLLLPPPHCPALRHPSAVIPSSQAAPRC